MLAGTADAETRVGRALAEMKVGSIFIGGARLILRVEPEVPPEEVKTPFKAVGWIS